MEPSSSPTFLSNSNPPLSSSESEFSDIEMTPLQSYTSLKDLLPDSPSPPPSTVAAPLHCPAWDELPIKNPLVKHAALAYLQPMLTPPVAGDRTFMRRLKKHGSSSPRQSIAGEESKTETERAIFFTDCPLRLDQP